VFCEAARVRRYWVVFSISSDLHCWWRDDGTKAAVIKPNTPQKKIQARMPAMGDSMGVIEATFKEGSSDMASDETRDLYATWKKVGHDFAARSTPETLHPTKINL
jgi:hypothetical protein